MTLTNANKNCNYYEIYCGDNNCNTLTVRINTPMNGRRKLILNIDEAQILYQQIGEFLKKHNALANNSKQIRTIENCPFVARLVNAINSCFTVQQGFPKDFISAEILENADSPNSHEFNLRIGKTCVRIHPRFTRLLHESHNCKNANDRNLRIIDDYGMGHSILQLSKKYDLTENRIMQILTQNGVRRPRWHKITPETKCSIFKMFEKGMTKAEISREIGISRERVRQILCESKANKTVLY